MTLGTNRPAEQPGNQSNRLPVAGRAANRLGFTFYGVVAAVALAGQTGAATSWLHWPVAVALPAVAALELGGITLSAQADHRRRLGERALAARLLAGAVATFAVVFNWVGHGDHLQGGFFAGMSALGYLVWLIQAGNRRRDQLRASGMLPPVPPAYPVWQWLRHPLITSRARHLALVDTSLSLYASLAQARAELRAERRERAIARLLRRHLAEGKDRVAAEIAITTYDLDRIAARLRDGADYDRLTELVADRLDPDRLLDHRPNRPPRSGNPKPAPAAVAPAPVAQPVAPATRAGNQRPSQQPETGRRLRLVGEPAAVTNARILRDKYGDRLPSSDRQIRGDLGWSYKRVVPAVEAYRAGLDLQQPSDDDEDDERDAAAASA